MEIRMAAAIATICPQITAKGREKIWTRKTFPEKKEKMENVPRMRTSPVAIVATDAGFAITNHVQP